MYTASDLREVAEVVFFFQLISVASVAVLRSNLPYSCGPIATIVARKQRKTLQIPVLGCYHCWLVFVKEQWRKLFWVPGSPFTTSEVGNHRNNHTSHCVQLTDSWIPDMARITLTGQERWFQDMIHPSPSFLATWNVGSVSGFPLKALPEMPVFLLQTMEKPTLDLTWNFPTCHLHDVLNSEAQHIPLHSQTIHITSSVDLHIWNEHIMEKSCISIGTSGYLDVPGYPHYIPTPLPTYPANMGDFMENLLPSPVVSWINLPPRKSPPKKREKFSFRELWKHIECAIKFQFLNMWSSQHHADTMQLVF